MPPKIAGLCPLIQVYDMLESLRFYRDVLGFSLFDQSPLLDKPYPHINWVWLKRDGAELMLNTAWEADERPAVRDATWCATHRDITFYIACPDVDDAYRDLLAAGIALDPPKVAPYGMKQLYLLDPDGYGLCLQWRAQH